MPVASASPSVSVPAADTSTARATPPGLVLGSTPAAIQVVAVGHARLAKSFVPVDWGVPKVTVVGLFTVSWTAEPPPGPEARATQLVALTQAIP